MAIPDPPTWNPFYNDLTPVPIPPLPVQNWILDTYLTNINLDAMQWLIAQGWEIDGTPTYDNTTTPPTPYFNLHRTGTANSAVLQSLVNVYTNEYNAGRAVNDLRYEEIVTNWSQMISAMTQHVKNMADTSNDAVAVWFGDLDATVTELKTKVTGAETELQTYVTDLWNKVDALADRFTSLENYYNNAATNLTTIITSESTAFSDYTTDYDAKIAEIEAALTSAASNIQTAITNAIASLATYTTAYDAAMADVVSEMTAHETAARAIEVEAESDLDTHISNFQLELDSLSTDYTSHLTAVNSLLASVDTAFSDHETEILALLTTILADHASYDGEIDTLLTAYDSTFSAHETTYEGILDLLLSDLQAHETTYEALLAELIPDHDTHSALTVDYLDGLGLTETARINEKFAASLSRQNQQLVDSGLYASIETAAIAARNTRDANEELVALNDRLNREKLDNQHKLYEQLFRARAANLDGQDKLYEYLVRVRKAALDGQDRLYGLGREASQFRAQMVTRAYELLQDVRNRTIAGKQQLHALQQDVLRYQVTIREALATRLEAMRDRTMAGLNAIQQLRDAMSRWLMDDQHRLYTEQLDVRNRQVDQAERQFAGRRGVYQAEIAARQSLLQLTESIHGQIVDAHSRYHESEQTVHRNEAAQRDTLLAKALATTQAIISGEAQANQLRQSNGEFLVNETHRLAAMLMDAKMQSYRIRMDQNARDMELMKYQADASNNLMVGLWTFQERRNDMYPSLDLITQLVSQLGNTGAVSWVQP